MRCYSGGAEWRQTVLLERYGTWRHGIRWNSNTNSHMSDGGDKPVIAGLSLEWLERLDKLPGAVLRRGLKISALPIQSW